jgi:hypothetical protein
MAWTETLGCLGRLLTLTTFSMRTMLRLRMVGIAANLAFIGYGLLGPFYPVLLLHVVLLPLNGWRLWQVLRLTRQIRDAATGRLPADWLKPFTRRRAFRAGQTLFRRGDEADGLSVVLSGSFRAVEADVVLAPGDVLGELGLVLPEQRRTQTVVCEHAGEVLALSYDEVRQMYFQDPRFGFYLLQLTAERLARDAARAAGAPAPEQAGGAPRPA